MPRTRKRRSAADHAKEEDVYSVERVVDKRITKDNLVQYLIKWEGYPDSENTWESAENCNCPELIRKFEENLIKSEPTVKKEINKSPDKKKNKEVKLKKTGFQRGLTAERILGASEQDGKLVFLIKWEGCLEEDLVYAEEANQKCPQVVIKFYESKLTWRDSENDTSAEER